MKNRTAARNRSYFKLPNKLLLDAGLSFSARRVGAVLYSRRNALGTCRKSLAALARFAACSVPTARKALAELEAAGYIARQRQYRYDPLLGQPVYDVQAYHCSLDFGQGYTLVPRSIFQYELRGSAFVVCLYLYFCLGNSSRAFPSLSRISSVLWMARSTVCQALACLREAGCILRQHCARANRTFSANSYFFLQRVEQAVSAVLAPLASALASVWAPFPRFHCSTDPVASQDRGVVRFFANIR